MSTTNWHRLGEILYILSVAYRESVFSLFARQADAHAPFFCSAIAFFFTLTVDDNSNGTFCWSNFVCYCTSKCVQYCPSSGIKYTFNQHRKRERRKKERKKEKRKKKIESTNLFHDAVNFEWTYRCYRCWKAPFVLDPIEETREVLFPLKSKFVVN